MIYQNVLECLSSIVDCRLERTNLMHKKLVTPNVSVAMIILATSMFYGVLILETGSRITNLVMCALTGITICLCIFGLCRMDKPFEGFTKFIETLEVEAFFVCIDTELEAMGNTDTSMQKEGTRSNNTEARVNTTRDEARNDSHSEGSDATTSTHGRHDAAKNSRRKSKEAAIGVPSSPGAGASTALM